MHESKDSGMFAISSATDKGERAARGAKVLATYVVEKGKPLATLVK